jgi:hypothetical protein
VSKSNALENDVVDFIFNATAFPSYGSILYVSLHTGDPGEAGDQTTNEATYTGYARVGVARDSGGWTVAGSQSSNTAEITFGECTAGSDTITHVGIGTSSTGAGTMLYSAALTQSINISALITPRFPSATLIVAED